MLPLVQLFINQYVDLNYFKIKAKANHPAELPDPNGPLSAAVPSSTIAAVNKKVSSTMEKSASTDKSRGPYSHLTDEQKYYVGKREHPSSASPIHKLVAPHR